MDFIGHFKTITRHRHLVMKHCFLCGIPMQGLTHDLSKYTPAEFLRGACYYEQGKRSPNEREREEKGYSAAWLHHKGRNKHHWEYWFDVSTASRQYEPVPMPINYLKESFCDRVAASKIYRGSDYQDSDPLDYFNSRTCDQAMHPCTACILKKWLTMLAEEGEEKTFAYLRTVGDVRCRPHTKK